MNKILIILLLFGINIYAETSDTGYSKMKQESYQRTLDLSEMSKKIHFCLIKTSTSSKAKKCLNLLKNREIKETIKQIVYRIGDGSISKKTKLVWNKNRKQMVLDELQRTSKESLIYSKCMKNNKNYKNFYRCLKRAGL